MPRLHRVGESIGGICTAVSKRLGHDRQPAALQRGGCVADRSINECAGASAESDGKMPPGGSRWGRKPGPTHASGRRMASWLHDPLCLNENNPGIPRLNTYAGHVGISIETMWSTRMRWHLVGNKKGARVRRSDKSRWNQKRVVRDNALSTFQGNAPIDRTLCKAKLGTCLSTEWSMWLPSFLLFAPAAVVSVGARPRPTEPNEGAHARSSCLLNL